MSDKLGPCPTCGGKQIGYYGVICTVCSPPALETVWCANWMYTGAWLVATKAATAAAVERLNEWVFDAYDIRNDTLVDISRDCWSEDASLQGLLHRFFETVGADDDSLLWNFSW